MRKNLSLRTRMNSSNNFFDFIRNREYGMRDYRSLNKYHGTRHILTNNLFKERSIPLQNMNKVYCSQWLSNEQIIFGTKCNKLRVYNVTSFQLYQIPNIICGGNTVEHQIGIRALKINPSRTMLATGGYNHHGIAIYRLPTFEPIILAEGAHNDLVCGIEWLDNDCFVSGSLDTNIALWKVRDHGDSIKPVTQFIEPAVIKSSCEKVCAMSFNQNLKEMATLAPNGYVHIWDVERFEQKFTRSLSSRPPHFCIASKPDSSLYAIGCNFYTLLIDSRAETSKAIRSIKRLGSSIHSLSFQDNIITIGTSQGVIMFFDIRAGKYLESSIIDSAKAKYAVLRTKKIDVYLKTHTLSVKGSPEAPAIFTHCYDYSGTRLFSAGGPKSPLLYGTYADIWQ